ncbi:MAG: 4-alpha-glucanotransferase [Treponema sp.]|nr:4-alpha-glucanotransferase [Treponema sp.]
MGKRKSGVLLHITSLPGTPGIGTLGREAYRFVDWLKNAGQTLWQILPLGPTGYGDSPYASFSTFAGNPLLIDLDDLVQRGWANHSDIEPPDYIKYVGPVDFGSVVWWKTPVLYKCAAYFIENASQADRKLFEDFKREQAKWLDNFAAFTSIKKFYDAKAQAEKIEGAATMWNRWWPKDLASHDEAAVKSWCEKNASDIEEIKAIQFFFNMQWQSLRTYANNTGIQIVGDIPIFVAADSADIWSNQSLFQFNTKTLKQKSCAGVPPDYFSATGQLWGNPLYDWSAMKKDGYAWWIDRIENMLRLVDVVRIDHFRAFDEYWQVPYGAENAIGGKWCKGPGIALFKAIKDKLGNLPIIAEDLGVITPGVEKLRDSAGFPGMKILQFAFNGNPWTAESSQNEYLPHNIRNPNCVVYTGTHDNDTTLGLIEKGGDGLKKNLCNYYNLYEGIDNVTVAHAMIRSAFSSIADICIIPMQDIFTIGSEGRMNTPSTTGCNWTWRMDEGMLNPDGGTELLWYSKMYGRNLPDEDGANSDA